MNALNDRSWLAAVLLAAGVLVMLSTDARAEVWCLRQFGSETQVCVFSSGRQCTSAAAIGGGICEREQVGRAGAAKNPGPRAGQDRSRAAGVPQL